MTAQPVSMSKTPHANHDTANSQENQSVIIDVMANDLGGSAKSLYSVNQSSLLTRATTDTLVGGATVSIVNGKVVYNSHNKFDYLAAGQTATDTFTYAIQLGNGTISTATVSVTVTGTNDAARGSATAVLAAGTEDETYALSEADLLKGFTDVDGGTLAVADLTATNGTLTKTATGWTFAPNADFNGKVELSYNVLDGQGGSTPATQSFSLASVNDAPTGIPDTANGTKVNENVPAGFQVADLNATDVDGDTITYHFKTAEGTKTQNDGNFIIDANTGVVTTARAFDYEKDGANLSFRAYAGDGTDEDAGTYTVAVGDVTEFTRQPLTLDFNGFSADTHWSTDDFTLYSRPQIRVYEGFTNYSYDSSYAADATNVILTSGYVSNYWAGRTTDIAREDGSEFDLLSIDLRNYAYATRVEIHGFRDGQSVAEVDVIPGSNWSTVTTNFQNIDQVQIRVEGTYNGGGWIAYDDMMLLV